MAQPQPRYKFVKGVKAVDGYYRPCFVHCDGVTCDIKEDCLMDSEPMYRVYNLNPDRFEAQFTDTQSYYIPSSILSDKLDDNATMIKNTHYYLDTHIKPPVDYTDSMNAYIPHLKPGTACMRVEPCHGSVSDHDVCCSSLSPPLVASNVTAVSQQVKETQVAFDKAVDSLRVHVYADDANKLYAQNTVVVDQLANKHITALGKELEKEDIDYQEAKDVFIRNTALAVIVICLVLVLIFAVISLRDLVSSQTS